MRNDPYTPNGMDSGRGTSESRELRFDELYAEAKSTLGYGANNLRSVTERYRESYREVLARWHGMRDQLELAERAPAPNADGNGAAAAAEAGAEDARQRVIRGDVERLTGDLGRHQQELSKLELSVRSMENAWLFLERGDASLLAEVADSGLPTDLQMASSELRFLRELLRRELGEVRTFISQLRPPLLDELGLDGSIMDAVESMAALTGATVETEL